MAAAADFGQCGLAIRAELRERLLVEAGCGSICRGAVWDVGRARVRAARIAAAGGGSRPVARRDDRRAATIDCIGHQSRCFDPFSRGGRDAGGSAVAAGARH